MFRSILLFSFSRIDPMVMNFWVEFQISPLNVILKNNPALYLFLKEPKCKISFGLSNSTYVFVCRNNEMREL